MPRGRSKSHTDTAPRTTSKYGIALFSAGLLVALFIGGAFRVLLSERQLRKWINDSIDHHRPKFSLAFEKVQTELADGFWPRVGVRISGVKLESTECASPWRLSADQIFLPLDVSALWQGRLRFGVIRSGVAEISRRPDCPRSLKADSSFQAQSAENLRGENKNSRPPVKARTYSSPHWWPKTHEYFQARWKKELAQSLVWFDGFDVHRLKIVDFYPAEVNNIKLRAMSSELIVLTAQTHLQLSPGEDSIVLSPSLRLEITGERLSYSVHGRFREGILETEGRIQLLNGALESTLKLTNVPTGPLFHELRQWGVVTDAWQTRRLWLNGTAQVQAQISDWWKAIVRLQNWELHGDAGKLQVAEVEIRPWSQEQKHSAFLVTFVGVSVDRILEVLGRKSYSGIFSKTGELNGRLTVTDQDLMTFNGELARVVLQFSHQKQKRLQPIEYLRGELALNQGRVTGLIQDVKLVDGEFAGFLSFDLDREMRSGRWQVKIDELSFAPEIEELMVLGQASSMAIYGRGEMLAGEIIKFEGDLGVDQILGASWSAESLRLSTHFEDDLFKLRIQGRRLVLMSEGILKPFQSIFSEALVVPVELASLQAQLEVADKTIKWRAAQVVLPREKFHLASSGLMTEPGHIKGVVTRAHMQRPETRWQGEISGRWPDLQIKSGSK